MNPELLSYPTDIQIITELNLGFDPRPEALLGTSEQDAAEESESST
jgi:hypothetical protein